MTQKEAQQRNHDIRMLRGMLPRLVSLIPQDVREHLEKHDIADLIVITNRVMRAIDKSKTIRYVCEDCKNKDETHITKNKRAYTCDICYSWGAPRLYIAKRN